MSRKTGVTMNRRVAALLIALCTAGPVHAQPLHSVILSVPLYGEEALPWCGPATAQMVMEGYPSGACSVLQEDIWTAVTASSAEAFWDTDPAGMRGALLSLCPPSGTWSIYHRTDPDELMHRVAYWMTRNAYPVALLQDTAPHNSLAAHGEHWVAVRGIVTDVDPTTSTTVTLENIWVHDPSPLVLGDPPISRFISGTQWLSELAPVTKAGSAWHGEYVAVIEPPQVKGRVVAPRKVLVGALIGPDEAARLAARYIKEKRLLELEPYKDLAGATALTPMVVNARHGGYYLVPYAVEGDLARFAVIVNAYDGAFEEAGAFAPVRYVTRERAVALARERLSVSSLGPQPEPPDLRAELFHPQGERVASRYHPLWRVKAGPVAVAVDQRGQVLTRVPRTEPSIPAVAARPSALAGDAGTLVILDPQERTVKLLDPASGAVRRALPVDVEKAEALAFDGTSVWIADTGRMRIVRTSVETGRTLSTIPIKVPPEKGFRALTDMTWDGRYLWTAISAGFSSSLNQVDPASGEIVRSIFADCDPRGIASDGSTLWTVCYNGPHRPSKIDRRPVLAQEHEMLRQREFIQDAALDDPRGLVLDGEHLRVLDRKDKRIYRYPANLAPQ